MSSIGFVREVSLQRTPACLTQLCGRTAVKGVNEMQAPKSKSRLQPAWGKLHLRGPAARGDGSGGVTPGGLPSGDGAPFPSKRLHMKYPVCFVLKSLPWFISFLRGHLHEQTTVVYCCYALYHVSFKDKNCGQWLRCQRAVSSNSLRSARLQ